MHQVIRYTNDKLLAVCLAVHITLGWVLLDTWGEVFFLAVGTISLVFGFCLYKFNRPFWLKTMPFHRFFLLLSLVFCSLYLQIKFMIPIIPVLHMVTIIIFSTFYLIPLMIWLVTVCYALAFIYYMFFLNTLPINVFLLTFCVMLILVVVTALHNICIICRDHMVQNRKLEREQNFERMGQQQHLATIGQIAASIAHDIRNPLTSIQGFVQLIEKNEKRVNFQGYYQIIRSEITRIDTLLREVLVLSKSHTADAESWELVHLDLVLQRLVVLMEPDALKSNIQIRLYLDKRPYVMGSEEKLQQVFLNLLRNAFEAISENGRIDVILSEQDGEAVILFQDTGPGISPGQLEQLFTPFFTTKAEGTGLGLSICKSIIKAYDGDIEVRNLPDRGAEFKVTLPI
jgi:signal transduction histidine kinase